MNDSAILLVDDEQAIVHMLDTILRKEGFNNIDKAYSGEQALAACASKKYDMIVLDIMMPGQSGLEICPFIRRTTDAPIFFLTAKSSDFDKLTGFALGGDDYITKPFNPLEVVARIKAQLRRYMRSREDDHGSTTVLSAPPFYDFGRFQLFPEAGELVVAGEPVSCPALVYQLLLFLCKNEGRIFTKSELYERVWGETAHGEDNTVMVHIHRIRERIEQDPGKPELLVNVRGIGYKLIRPGERNGT
ncbi:DNA-binding response regulator [Paenibacillaceae bacterium]|nr:DNA-binding response regulator [Paenibacillaceae bacterium]